MRLPSGVVEILVLVVVVAQFIKFVIKNIIIIVNNKFFESQLFWLYNYIYPLQIHSPALHKSVI